MPPTSRSSARRHRGRHPMVGRTDVRKPTINSAPRKTSPTVDPTDAITFWQSRLERPLFVYFIQDGAGSVKIGKAHHPLSRLAELQCGNPRPLTLRHVVLAAQDTEETLHRAWSFARGLGEWFGDGYQRYILTRAAETQARQVKTADTMPAHEITAMVVEIVKPHVR